MADAADLNNLSAPVGNPGVDGAKFGETFPVLLIAGNAELQPDQAVKLQCRGETAPS